MGTIPSLINTKFLSRARARACIGPLGGGGVSFLSRGRVRYRLLSYLRDQNNGPNLQRPDPPRPSRDDASTFWRVARPIRPMMGASGTALRRSERPALVQESGQPLGPGGPPALRAWMEWPESGRFLAGAGAHGPLLYSRARAGRWELASDRLQGQGRRVECPGRPARSTSGGSGRFGPLWWT